MMRARHTTILTLLLPTLALAQAPEAPAEPAAPPAEAPAEPAAPPAAAPDAAAQTAEGSDPPADTPAEAPAEPPAAAEPPAEAPATPPAAAAPAEPPAASGGPVDVGDQLRPRRRGDDDIHITMRWGMRIHLDPAYDALGDDRNHFAAEIGVDVRVWRQLAVGFSFTGSSEQGTLYGRDTVWIDNSIFLSAVYRHRFQGLGLSTYGRLGPTVHWYQLSMGDEYDSADRFEDDPWHFGARAAAGLEFWPFSPDFIPHMGRFGVGVVLEGYYDQALQTEWSSGGVDPGEFDPTGPGWSLGVTGRF